jgi:hypothetical protein
MVGLEPPALGETVGGVCRYPSERVLLGDGFAVIALAMTACLEGDIAVDASPSASPAIVRPTKSANATAVDQRSSAAARMSEEDADLTVLVAPRSAGILPLDPAERPLLQEAVSSTIRTAPRSLRCSTT